MGAVLLFVVLLTALLLDFGVFVFLLVTFTLIYLVGFWNLVLGYLALYGLWVVYVIFDAIVEFFGSILKATSALIAFGGGLVLLLAVFVWLPYRSFGPVGMLYGVVAFLFLAIAALDRYKAVCETRKSISTHPIPIFTSVTDGRAASKAQ